MRTCVFPGSFDPITEGHLDIIRRAASLFDQVIIGVVVNEEKRSAFTLEKRLEMVKKCTADMPNVACRMFDGLITDFMRQCGSRIVLRSMRSETDYAYEAQLFGVYRHLDEDIEMVFMISRPQYAHISSSVVRQIAAFRGEVRGLVPDVIYDDVVANFHK